MPFVTPVNNIKLGGTGGFFSLRLSSYYSHFLCQNNTVPGIQGDSILVTNGCPQRGWFHVEETVPLHFTRRAMARGSLFKGWEQSQHHGQSLSATGGGLAKGSMPPRSDGRAKRAATGTGRHPKRSKPRPKSRAERATPRRGGELPFGDMVSALLLLD